MPHPRESSALGGARPALAALFPSASPGFLCRWRACAPGMDTPPTIPIGQAVNTDAANQAAAHQHRYTASGPDPELMTVRPFARRIETSRRPRNVNGDERALIKRLVLEEDWTREDVAELLAISKTAVRRALLTDEQLVAERQRANDRRKR